MIREVVILVRPDPPGEYGAVIEIGDPGTDWGRMVCLDTFLVAHMDLAPEQAATLLEIDEGTGLRRNRVDLSGVDLAAIRAADWLVPVLPWSIV